VQSADTPLPISVTLIARNEALNLPRCLGSVQGWVSEIIVVVNDCTDTTVEIAHSFGATVVENLWSGFGNQKRRSVELAKEPWILAIDADEEVSPQLKAAIFHFFKEQSTSHEVVAFRRRVWFLGRWITHGDWYPDWSPRLFRKDCANWSQDLVHERLLFSGSLLKLRADLLHYSNPTIASHVGKINFFSDLFLVQQLERNAKWSSVNMLFRAAWRFVRAYIFRLGFMDGFPGLFIAVSTAYATFVRYSRLYEHLYNTPPPVQTSRADSGGKHIQRP
jgi:glycosyltransferase involved in cell wall biosynthesis